MKTPLVQKKIKHIYKANRNKESKIMNIKLVEGFSKENLLERIEKVFAETSIKYDVIASFDKKSAKKGAKSFLAFRSYSDFYIYIMKKNIERHFYEVLDGAKPSKFYLDIEHKNECKCGVDIFKELIPALETFLESIFLTLGKLLVLTSDSKDKDSYHIIVKSDWIIDNNI